MIFLGTSKWTGSQYFALEAGDQITFNIDTSLPDDISIPPGVDAEALIKIKEGEVNE